MSEGGSHNVADEVKTFTVVFWLLIVGTILTVGAWFVHLKSVALTLFIGLIIATAKASLVAGFFMHLVAEKKLIYWVMAFTFFFFAAMMFLIIWGFYDYPQIQAENVP